MAKKKQEMVKIKMIKGYHHRKPKHRATVAALGLRKINQEKILPANDSVLGMINQISYLLEVTKVEN